MEFAIDGSFMNDPYFAALTIIWLIGAAACLIWTTIAHRRFCRRLRHVIACEDQRLGSLWEDCCKLAGVRRNIRIFLFDGVPQPAIMGLFRPKLLLPPDVTELNDEQLRMIMLHELGHVRHWDIAANWALVVIRAVHWWNPVYWLAATRFQSLREQACDAFAIRRIEGQLTRGYGDLLLTLAQRRQSGPSWRVMLPVSILGFFSSYFRKRAVGNRIKSLRSAGVTRSRWHTAGVASLVALVAACGLTDASTPETAPARSPGWHFGAGHDWDWDGEPEIDRARPVKRMYDVEKALNRIAVDEATENDARLKLDAALRYTLKCSSGGNFSARTEEWAKKRITLDGINLTVNATPNAHAEIAKNLSAWEQSGLSQICVEPYFMTDERDIATEFGISWRYLEASSADRDESRPSDAKTDNPAIRAKAHVDEFIPIAVAVLNDQQASVLLPAAREANPYGRNLTLFNGQKTSLSNCIQIPYATGTIHDDGTGGLLGELANAEEGVKLTWRAIQINKTQRVQFEGRLEMSRICNVDTASRLRRGEIIMPDATTDFQLPRIRRCQIDVASEIQQGQSLLIAVVPMGEEKNFFYVLLTLRSILPPAEMK